MELHQEETDIVRRRSLIRDAVTVEYTHLWRKSSARNRLEIVSSILFYLVMTKIVKTVIR
jgi:hypothetical protein